MPRGTPGSNLFRVLESRTPGLNRGRQLAGALALLLAHRAGFAGVPAGTPAASPNGRPNIILIVLDTVRADAVGPRSNGKTNTPFLDAWGRKGIVFRKAISPADYTSSSHFSMLTGAPPSLRGTADDLPGLSVVSMLNDAGYDTLGLSANAVVDPGTLACAAPFQTFVSSPYVTPTSVSQELFERFLLYRTGSGEHVAGQDSNLGKLLCSAEEMNVRLERLLASCGGSKRPRFVFLNLVDAHHPYMPPKPFAPSAERLAREFPVNGDPRGGRPDLGNEPRESGGCLPEWYHADRYSPASLRFLRELYDAEIRHVDHELRRTFEILARAGLLENAIVVVTSDHGEAFGEHGLLAHGMSQCGVHLPEAYEVPLLIRSYGLTLRATDRRSEVPRTIRLADSIRVWAGTAMPGRPDLDPLAVPAAKARESLKAPIPVAREAAPGKTDSPSAKLSAEQRRENEELARRLRSLGYLH